MNLKQNTLDKIDKLIPRYPTKRSAVLPLLHLIQEETGHISKTAMEWVAEKLDLEPINVYEVVTFYPMLREKPIGRRHIKVCRTLSCALNGSYEVKKQLEKQLLGEGKGSSNEDYTIEFVECIASCGTAPVVQVDEVLHEGVKPDCVAKFADKLRDETQQMKLND